MTIAPEPAQRHGRHPVPVPIRYGGSLVIRGAPSAETMQAFDAARSHVTHMFNAMRPFHHREPGLSGRPAAIPALPAGHCRRVSPCHPETINLLVSIQTVPQAEPDHRCHALRRYTGGDYQSFGKTIHVNDGKVTLERPAPLPASTLTMEKAVRNMQQICRTCRWPK